MIGQGSGRSVSAMPLCHASPATSCCSGFGVPSPVRDFDGMEEGTGLRRAPVWSLRVNVATATQQLSHCDVLDVLSRLRTDTDH